MEIIDFFNNISNIIADEKSIIYFTADTYQPIFLEKLKMFIEKKIGASIQKISPEQSFNDIQARLSTTFLGQIQWFWLQNLELKKQAELSHFLKYYTGPHRLIILISQEESELLMPKNQVYTIANGYTNDQAKKISLLYENQKPEIIAYFFSKLFSLKKEYSLDQLCLFQEYAGLLGSNTGSFFHEWIDKLVVSDVSLFYISQLFFEKNGYEFFIQWHKVRQAYPNQFWTAFFSEQLYKAYFYVHHNGHVPVDQKQLTYGLPFAFLKHDWKLYSCLELQKAHQSIYDIELSLKRNASYYQLDVFCMSFFNNLFL